MKVNHTAEEAIQQIRDREYALRFRGRLGQEPEYTGRILAVGIAYDKDDKTKKHSCKAEVLRDRSRKRVLIIEAKHANDEKHLEAACRNAVEQIDSRRYADELKKGYRTVLCYGIAFFDKQCLVRRFECSIANSGN